MEICFILNALATSMDKKDMLATEFSYKENGYKTFASVLDFFCMGSDHCPFNLVRFIT